MRHLHKRSHVNVCQISQVSTEECINQTNEHTCFRNPHLPRRRFFTFKSVLDAVLVKEVGLCLLGGLEERETVPRVLYFIRDVGYGTYEAGEHPLVSGSGVKLFKDSR